MSKGNMPEMALLIVGFDGYSDLWKDYFKLLNKFWGDRPYPTYISNNTLNVSYDNVSTINCGEDAEWSRKVQKAIKIIDQEYICLLLEDFFTGDYVDNNEIKTVINYMKENDIKYYKLNTFSKIDTRSYNDIGHLKTIPENLPYGISVQPAIWKKQYLQQLLGTENYNAWVFEFDRVKESIGKSNNPISGCVYDSRNILNIQHGVVQGKFLPQVVKYFKNIGEPLDTTYRRQMNVKEYTIYKFKRSAKAYIPKKLIKPVKRVLNVFGLQFVSDKYKARE